MSRLSHRRDQSGATAVEYAIMVGLIAAVIIVAVAAMGQTLGGDYDCVAGYVADPASAPSPTVC